VLRWPFLRWDAGLVGLVGVVCQADGRGSLVESACRDGCSYGDRGGRGDGPPAMVGGLVADGDQSDAGKEYQGGGGALGTQA
jgi:hypothetical protein